MATINGIHERGAVEPPPDLHTWRELVSRRRHLVQQRAEVKNRVRALLRKAGLAPPRKPALWTKAGLQWLAKAPWPTPDDAFKAEAHLREIQTLERQIRQMEVELRQIANSPAVLRLVQLTGFGFRTAEAVLAALEDWRRTRG